MRIPHFLNFVFYFIIVADFMGKKQHAKLSTCFEAKFPELFGYEKCGLLMVDREDSSLFKVVVADPTSSESDSDDNGPRTPTKDAGENDEPERTFNANNRHQKRKPIYVKFPKDRGLTGVAIKSKKVAVAHEGEYNVAFAPEIDNCIGSQLVRNCMTGPCIDSTGILRGIVIL